MGDINSMTLAEIESLAERLGAAAKTIRDAQSLLGVQTAPVESAPAPMPHNRFAAVVVPGAPGTNRLSSGEMAERQRLMKQFTPDDVPADIAEAMNESQS